MVEELDVSVLLEPGKMFAVKCKTQEEADIFIEFMKRNYPDKVRSWNGPSDHYWSQYYGRTCYSPCLNGEGARNQLTYYYEEWFNENGYIVVDCESLRTQFMDICQDEFACLFDIN